jgi:hypothetical protein
MLEYDFDNPVHRQRRCRPPPPLEGEILTPEPEPTIVRVDVRHRRRSIAPRVVTIGALVIVVLILFRSPGALILLAALVPPTMWIAAGVIVAILTLMAIISKVRGHPF